MAVSGLSWSISFTVGPYFAGLILDSAHPNLLWAFCGIFGMLAAIGFKVLNKAHATRSAAVETAAAD
jgi:MFS family permease